MKPQINKWATVIIAVLFASLVIMPLIRNDIGLARNPDNYMSEGWQEATQYLRSQLTLEQEVEYYKSFQNGEELTVPKVLAWWDYGYWIVREAHMPVISSPGGGDRGMTARLLMSDNSYLVISQLKSLNIKYIVIDSQTATEKFYSVVAHAYLDLNTYYGVDLHFRLWRTEAFYKTILARLYFFDGDSTKGFMQDSIFPKKSNSVLASPIDLEKFDGIELVFQSSNKVLIGDDYISEVKVFEVK